MVANAYEPSSLSFVLLNDEDSRLEVYLRSAGFDVARYPISGVLNKAKSAWNLFRIFISKRPEVIHVHNRIAYLLSIPLAWLTRVPSRIYTRHHSTYQHLYHPDKIWLDKLTNRLSTRIVAICQNVSDVLTQLEGVKEEKIVSIPHGFYLEKFKERDKEMITRLRKRHNIPEGRIIIGMVSRFIKWKGVEFMLQAMPDILESVPDALLVLANANGPDEARLNALIEELPVDSVIKLDFEEDIISLYHLMDVFVHLPIDPSVEAFGQIYVEALAARTPMVCTLSGVAHEFIEDGENALVVPYEEYKPVAHAVLRILQEEGTRSRIIENGQKSVQTFGHQPFIEKLRALHGQ